ncbi:MAG: hypothetical protein R6X22_12005 [Gemmatimonadota bacterium]
MDYFGRDQLRELLDVTHSPAVSIYMPTVRKGAEVQAQPLRLRAQLQKARELLAGSGVEKPEQMLGRFDKLVANDEFWQHQADGLALFAANGFERSYRLSAEVPELVVVAPSFHTRPLVELLQTPDRFWVLVLSQKEVRLWGGSPNGLAPVNLETVPTSLREALGFQLEKDRLSMHSSGGHGSKPIFHGHGAGKDDAKPELEMFFRLVDAGVREFLADEIGPVILAAVDYYHPIYRGITRIENLAPEGIVGSVTDWDPIRLHEAAWPIARAGVSRKIDEALALWENSYGKGKVETDLVAAGRLAVAGRIRLLLTERWRRIWGRFDDLTGELDVIQVSGADPGGDSVDLLDELAECALRHGGRAMVLPKERMPTDNGIAVILR